MVSPRCLDSRSCGKTDRRLPSYADNAAPSINRRFNLNKVVVTGSKSFPQFPALRNTCFVRGDLVVPGEVDASIEVTILRFRRKSERARQAELERVQAEGETREALARAAEQRRRPLHSGRLVRDDELGYLDESPPHRTDGWHR
jgi:hypothetical protein